MVYKLFVGGLLLFFHAWRDERGEGEEGRGKRALLEAPVRSLQVKAFLGLRPWDLSQHFIFCIDRLALNCPDWEVCPQWYPSWRKRWLCSEGQWREENPAWRTSFFRLLGLWGRMAGGRPCGEWEGDMFRVLSLSFSFCIPGWPSWAVCVPGHSQWPPALQV